MQKKGVIIISKDKCCPPHNLPHKLPFSKNPVTDEPCHIHTSLLGKFHHNLFCKLVKCPNYEFMKSKQK